nr:phosphoenolpyruvate carboxykinase (ATP) 1-like [Arachis hypogaea]
MSLPVAITVSPMPDHVAVTASCEYVNMVKVGIIGPLKVIKIGEYVNNLIWLNFLTLILGMMQQKVAGTDNGIKEPTVIFSACFGAAFIMLHPTKYATMLAEKMEKHGATGWLVKTGWSGGKYGYGSRIKLSYTRKIIDAIHPRSLLNAEYKKTEIFGVEISTEVEGVTSEILDPINTIMAWDMRSSMVGDPTPHYKLSEYIRLVSSPQATCVLA